MCGTGRLLCSGNKIPLVPPTTDGWHTAVTGLWQTVWLEAVPTAYIQDLKGTPQVDQERAKIEVEAKGAPEDYRVRAVVQIEQDTVAWTTGWPPPSTPRPQTWGSRSMD